MRWWWWLLLGLLCGFVLRSASAQEINPEKPPDPLNKIYFGLRTRPEPGHLPKILEMNVDTVAECIENAAKMLAKEIEASTKAVEVHCIKERNAEKPL